MMQPTEGRPLSGTVVAVRGDRGGVEHGRDPLPGLDTDNGSPSAIDIHSDATERTPSTLPPKSTATIAARAAGGSDGRGRHRAGPPPQLVTGRGQRGPPVRLPAASATVPFSWPAAPTPAPTAPTMPPPTTPPVALRPVVPPTTRRSGSAKDPDPFTSNGDSTIEEVLIDLPEFYAEDSD